MESVLRGGVGLWWDHMPLRGQHPRRQASSGGPSFTMSTWKLEEIWWVFLQSETMWCKQLSSGLIIHVTHTRMSPLE